MSATLDAQLPELARLLKDAKDDMKKQEEVLHAFIGPLGCTDAYSVAEVATTIHKFCRPATEPLLNVTAIHASYPFMQMMAEVLGVDLPCLLTAIEAWADSDRRHEPLGFSGLEELYQVTVAVDEAEESTQH